MLPYFGDFSQRTKPPLSWGIFHCYVGRHRRLHPEPPPAQTSPGWGVLADRASTCTPVLGLALAILHGHGKSPIDGWFPFKTSINRGFPIAMFDCRKVMHTIQGSHPFLSIWAPWCPWISRVASPSAQKPLEWWKHLRISSFRLHQFPSGMVSESKCAPPSESSWNILKFLSEYSPSWIFLSKLNISPESCPDLSPLITLGLSAPDLLIPRTHLSGAFGVFTKAKTNTPVPIFGTVSYVAHGF